MTDDRNRADRFLLLREIEALHPVSRSTRWRMIKAGQFPASTRISKGRIAWRESEVLEWMAKR
ncbi:MAG: AlpA family phage regulatory protein [Verrucomicrobiaceae bacterium]|nr:MAG: AlpA family phage regulatory protein [Verrucomicrobiaceae bacterium]